MLYICRNGNTMSKSSANSNADEDYLEINEGENDDYHPESHLQADSHLILLIDNSEMRVFVMLKNDIYHIFGRRQNDSNFPVFQFTYKTLHDVNNVIDILFTNNHLLSNKRVDFYVYNFNNMRNKYEDELCYEFFEEQMEDNYMISVNRDVNLSSAYLNKYLVCQNRK